MEKELGADVIKATQSSLGKYVKRPPLTEKLLRKPPFRFLHDIVLAVLKTTGFFEGLFDDDELISENVKDRDSKILFLNKVIAVIGTTTGKSLSVKSSKVVAGQEADKTNELLQYLAFALDKKLSSDEAVKLYKENVKTTVSTEKKVEENETSKTIKQNNDSKNLASKSNEKLTAKKRETGSVNKTDRTNNESKIKKKEGVIKNDIQTKKSLHLKNKTTVTSKNNLVADSKVNQKVLKKEYDEKPKEEENNKEVEQQNDIYKKEVLKDTDNEENTKDLLNGNDQDNAIFDNDINSLPVHGNTSNAENITQNDKENTDFIEDHDSATKDNMMLPVKNNEPVLMRNESNDSIDKSSELEKSKTIDKGINNLSRKNSDVIRPPSVRPPSSRPGAPRLREKSDNIITDNESLLLAKVNIITENTNNEEDEESNVIFVEQKHGEQSLQNQEDQLQLSSNEHGHLVQQILDSHKEFSQMGKTEIEWQFGAQKVKEAVNQEIEQLRFNIQALSRGANPLGKLLDHIQEDTEVMRQELQQWTNVYDEVSKEMQKQKTANEVTLFPLQSRIKQLDADIQEKRDKINDFKILIYKNVSRIEKLLLNGNVQ